MKMRCPAAVTVVICAAICGAVFISSANAEVKLRRDRDGVAILSNTSSWVGGSKRALERASSYTHWIGQYSLQHDLPPDLVRAVILVESAFNPAAVSSKGAVGLMQLMPATAAELAVRDRYDPEQNINGGAKYLRWMLDEFGGDLTRALAAYNAGPEAVRRHGGVPPYAETQQYVRRVLSVYRGETLPVVSQAPKVASRDGRKTYVRRDAQGRLVLTTERPRGR